MKAFRGEIFLCVRFTVSALVRVAFDRRRFQLGGWAKLWLRSKLKEGGDKVQICEANLIRVR